ncbi:O-antigen polymerase [Kaistella sp.]|uniref:O-antigen polymerase n=1 Tax=Kaistella sp. TaxID=2782235 RepID=UPI0035A08E97
MKLILNIFFCLFAGLLCIAAPNRYSYEFCLLILMIFLGNVVYFFLSNKTGTGNAATFDFFFIFSYGMVNFIYPVFYKPYNPNYTIFEYPFNHNVISKSTAIAYLGFTFFVLGKSSYKTVANTVQNYKREELPDFKVNGLFVRSIFLVAIASLIGYIATGGLKEIQNVYSGSGGSLNTVGLFSYFNNVFVICANLLAIFVFLVRDKVTKMITFAFIIFCSLMMLTTGSRTLVLGLGLILFTSYGRFVKRISLPKMMIILLIGSLFMTFIQVSRTQQFSGSRWVDDASRNLEIESPFDIFNDLVVNNRNLYVLVDFADKTGHVFFLSAISDLTSPIPGAFSYISDSVGLPLELITGGALPTFIEFGADSDWGLGTNLVGETYVGYGFYGICIIMFLIGAAVKYSYRYSDKSIYSFVIYYLLVSHAVFFPRAFYLYQPRTLVWSILLIFILLRITNSISKRRSVTSNISIEI